MNINQYLPFLLFGGFLAVIIISIVFGTIRAKKRTESLKSAALEIGFLFEGDAWNHQPKAHQFGTPLFEKGSRQRFNNIMTGTTSGLKTSLFDYSYTTGGGKDSSTYTQTVAAYSQDLWLPIFELRPEGFFDRVGEAFVRHDIDFESYPDFSKRYFLRGPAEATIRALFSPSLIAFLEQLPADEKWHVEGLDTTLVIYCSNTIVSVDELRPFLDKTSSIARAFFNSPKGLSKPVR
jgi:hypothetical protein